MLRKTKLLLIILVLFFVSTKNAFAQNNKFGIHIFDESDLNDAAELVNSSGGEWGYVTIVIRKDEMDAERWQKAFDQMRRLKLIPIVRLATTIESDGTWKKPLQDDAPKWAEFLGSLNWPVKNKYVVLFNEPNHASEWGGRVLPVDYTRVARTYWEELKKSSEDFFVLPAGLDQVAPNSDTTMDETLFLQWMQSEDTEIFTLFDGWSTHSYPNPDFSGSRFDTGRGSINGYLWELEILSEYGIAPDTPIFITETGWKKNNFTSSQLIENYKYAFDVWSAPQVQAVTPFILRFESEPFANFSWKDPSTGEFLPHTEAVKDLEKQKGNPEQIHSFSAKDFPEQLISNSQYQLEIDLENTGQSIWYPGEFELALISDFSEDSIFSLSQAIEPGQAIRAMFPIKTPGLVIEEENILTLEILKEDKSLVSQEFEIQIVPPPSIIMLTRPWFGRYESEQPASLFISSKGSVVATYTNLLLANGQSQINEVRDLVPGQEYAYTLKTSGIAPMRIVAILSPDENRLNFGRQIPIDFNNDSNFSFTDIVAAIISPLNTIAHVSNINI